MKAIFLVKNGDADTAFEIRETDIPTPAAGEVTIKVEGSGLNFADVMARRGIYGDAPPLPSILGYDVVGRIHEVGEGVSDLAVGQRVMAMTRFGGYAEYVKTMALGVAPIGENIGIGEATALVTQYCTAYFSAYQCITLHKGDHVLIHAAAGGVGTALVQMAKQEGCIVYGTASPQKHDYLREQGVDFPIDYRSLDFEEEIKKIRGEEGLDVVFDNVGGKSFKKGMRLLAKGGRIVAYGAAAQNNNGKVGTLRTIRVALGFGFYSPIALLMKSQGMIGVNMLRIADNRPHLLKHCLVAVAKMTDEGILRPTVGGIFKAEKISEAHTFLESRKSIGKIVIDWS